MDRRLNRVADGGFLDAAREEKLWNKAEQTVLDNAGTLTVEALKIARSMLMQQTERVIA